MAKNKQQLVTELRKTIYDISDNVYFDNKSIFPFFSFREEHASRDFHIEIPNEVYHGEEVFKDFVFEGFDDYLWLTKTVEVPLCPIDCEIMGIFDFGCTGPGFNSGFESLVYIDKKPYQGVDTEHNEINLTRFAGKTIEITFMIWSGLNGGPSHKPLRHVLARADICFRRNHVYHLMHELKAACKSVEMIRKVSEKTELLNLVVSAISKLEFDNLNASAAAVLDEIHIKYAELQKLHPAIVSCVGHTHIDVAWLWRLCHTREKAIRSFSTVMRLMEEYPEFLFLQSQPQLYAFIKNDYPELFEQIKERVKENRWECDGAMWLEADCNITSGESLTRQLIHGIRFIEKEFGVQCKHLWLPDVFGYSYALPQLLKLAHIETFMTTKISWNDTNRFPFDLFKWRGIDGSEVLSYFPTTPDPMERGDPLINYRTRYNGFMDPLTIEGSWRRFRQKEKSNEIFISYGLGDGGGGVTREMLEARRAIDKIPYMPSVKPSFARDFFERIHKNVENSNIKLPVWDNEIYLEFHRGTYTSQANNKKNNRFCENMLYMLEWLNVIGVSQGNKSIQNRLNLLWEKILLNQFHDIIPGSSIHEVYEDSAKDYKYVISSGSKHKSEICQKIVDTDVNTITVFNPSPFAVSELLKIESTKNGHFENESGDIIPCQKIKSGYLVLVKMEALSFITLKFVEGKENFEIPFKYLPDFKVISTPFYDIEFNDKGQIVNLYDKEYEREVLNEPANILRLYDDKPTQFDAWNIDKEYVNSYSDLSVKSVNLVRCGPQILTVQMVYGGCNCEIIQNVKFYSNNRRIDFENKITWNESHKLLKTLFPVNLVCERANFDTQYGYISRSTGNEDSFERAKFEVAGHKWADLSDNTYGFALMNNCKYGYSAKGNLLTLSLLRSPKEPDAEADMGIHKFIYSILPHNANVKNSDVIPQANALNNRLFYVNGKIKSNNDGFICRCTNPHIQIDAIKIADDGNGFILRLHEAFGLNSKFEISFPFEIEGWSICDLLEVPQEETNQSSVISDVLTPFTIRTYRIFKKF